MKSIAILAVVFGALAGVGGRVLLSGDPHAADPEAARRAAAALPPQVTANGVVEGARPEVALRPEVVGAIAVVHVKEGQNVKRGTPLAELRNDAQRHQLALAAAEVGTAKAQLEILRNGERAEKRRAMAAVVKAKELLHQQAEADAGRSKRLAGTGSVTQEQADADRFRLLRSKVELEEAKAQLDLVEAPARSDEVAAAEARIAAAEARQRVAQAELDKTRLLAPSDGEILQVFAEPGEMAGPTSAQPILILADLSKRRVRAFVEELDVARVKPGQRAVVTADGLPGKEFVGRVASAISRMGKRSPLSDVPGEYKDLYYREVMIDLDTVPDLPTNLRVQVAVEVPQ
jgi:multidrug resistance efflux pump